MRLRLNISFVVLISILFACVPASGQDADSAKTFVGSLYKNYGPHGTGKGTTFRGARAHLYYHSSLLDLMRADDKAANGDMPAYADADPICSCQDWDGIWDLKIEIQLVNADSAIAHVSFNLSPPGKTRDVRRVTMTLAPENGQWRIWNIVDESGPPPPFDIRKAILEELHRLEKVKK